MKIDINSEASSSKPAIIKLAANASAVVNFPISEGKVAGKIFATMIEDDGWLPNITLGKKVTEKDYQKQK